MSQRKRYALVGTGGRCRMFLDAMADPFKDHAQIVGLCDLSPTRMAYWNRHLVEQHGLEPVPMFEAERFEEMIEQTRPDAVIVTTMDSVHHLYIVRAMELGCDVITEKPMTIDAEKAQLILDTAERTGRDLRVTFNYRYMPAFSKLREIVASGQIGQPLLVDFQWRLDTRHGADYFRRWHREKSCSGGLLVHKSTHHFDLVNWIIGSRPQTVFAMGRTAFYGKANAEARGLVQDYDRYTDEPAAAEDPFALRLEGEMDKLYRQAEADSGYVRDRNVFSDCWPLDAEDTMAVQAWYDNKTILSYSLIAYSPWEGERLTITGTEGQVEYFGRGKGHVIQGQSDAELAEQQYQGERYVRLQRMFESAQEVELEQAKGGHGGGDRRLLERIFLPDAPADPLGRDAGAVDGAASILLGVAANRSIATGRPVSVGELMRLPDAVEASAGSMA